MYTEHNLTYPIMTRQGREAAHYKIQRSSKPDFKTIELHELWLIPLLGCHVQQPESQLVVIKCDYWISDFHGIILSRLGQHLEMAKSVYNWLMGPVQASIHLWTRLMIYMLKLASWCFPIISNWLTNS